MKNSVLWLPLLALSLVAQTASASHYYPVEKCLVWNSFQGCTEYAIDVYSTWERDPVCVEDCYAWTVGATKCSFKNRCEIRDEEVWQVRCAIWSYTFGQCLQEDSVRLR